MPFPVIIILKSNIRQNTVKQALLSNNAPDKIGIKSALKSNNKGIKSAETMEVFLIPTPGAYIRENTGDNDQQIQTLQATQSDAR